MLKRLITLCFLLLLSCASPQPAPMMSLQVRPDQALLTVYLSATGASELDSRVRLEDVAVEVDGVWIDLGLQMQDVSFLELKKRQQLLGASIAPLGEHRALRLRVSGLPIEAGGNGGQEQFFKLTLPQPLELAAGDSKCLFVDWQLVREQPGSKQLMSSFSAWGQGQTLGSELLYVASAGIDTVYVARIDTNEVVSAFGVPGPLAEIQLRNDVRRLYVLSSGRRAIYVYDCINARLIDQISLPGSIAPQNMVLSADGKYAFVSDAAAGTVFKVELAGGNLIAVNRIGLRPHRMAYLADGSGRLAVVAPSANQVFILNAEDLKTQRSIPVGLRPAGLLYFAGALYVAESGSQTVAVFNYQSGQQLAKITVGLRPDSLLSVDQNNAYVSNSGAQNLSVLSARQAMAFRKVATVQNPTEMVYSTRKRFIYVESATQNAISVIERDSETLLLQIYLGGVPKSLAILE